jgi:DNA-binding response OmpR family regulator
VTSGLDRDKDEDTSRQIRAASFLQKPFTAETLLTQVHAVLTKKSDGEPQPTDSVQNVKAVA